MDVLPCTFQTLLRWGAWYDDNESDTILKIAYRTAVITLVYYVTGIEFIELLNPTDVNDLSTSLYLTLCFMALCLKWLNFIFRRKKLSELLNKFRTKACQPQTPAEKAIVEKYSRIAGTIHNYLVNCALGTALVIVIHPLMKIGTPDMELPFKAYHPYDTSKLAYFCVSYAILGFGEVYAAVLNGCFDTLTIGCIFLASGQFELCGHRLQSHIEHGVISDPVTMGNWLAHHVLVIRIVRDIQTTFIGVIIPFFFFSLIILCTSVFQLYQKSIFSSEFITFFVYLACVMFESFLYCWAGYELSMKCENVVHAAYNSDWTKLNPRERKCLLTIMQIGQREVTISFQGQCTLSIQTFTWIMKTSYGAFNLLKGVSEL